ncbi:MAG: HupE/UreJ family protein [Flavobacterium sp.]|uniref:HupE/UreJ family protein n=1 Tax=Flavobacterium sp. TaxID=239 RepID=UPI002613E9D5|nr:HupE/UreJ family protein [Flavobacterium sp.]MDD5151371.1 HupE/UreJ family protein [Flavobacterium sp.]
MSLDDFLFYFQLGWSHLVSFDALDHQLFILSLIALYTISDIKKIVILVTAFTIGHSITLFLSVIDVFRLQSNWVEFLIPCTIIITALSNISKIKSKNNATTINYYFAMGFGLIHGMGFANTIRMILAKDQIIGWGLLSFNIGLEIGQLFFVAFILLLTTLALEYFKVKKSNWVLFISAAVFSLSLQMALKRIPLN